MPLRTLQGKKRVSRREEPAERGARIVYHAAQEPGGNDLQLTNVPVDSEDPRLRAFQAEVESHRLPQP